MSPSTVWQAFGKVGWQTEKTDLDLSYTYADTSLFGNGAAPLSMLDVPPADQLHPGLHPQPAAFREPHGHAVPVGAACCSPANAFYRHLITGSSNGSNNDNYLSEDYAGAAARLQPAARGPHRDRLLLPGRHPGRHAGAAHGRIRACS